MSSRPWLPVVAVCVLALAVTAGIFVAGQSGDADPKIEGKLSKAVLDFEVEYRATQEGWRTKEAEFSRQQDFQGLSRLQERFVRLSHQAATLKGESEAEKAALPHLVKSARMAATVPEPFLLSIVNPGLAKPEVWAQARENAQIANAEWKTWLEMTKHLSR